VSLAINAGVDSQIVAAASKHKDVNSVKGYYVPDQLAVSRATVACASTALRASMVDTTTSSSEQLEESVVAMTHMTLQQPGVAPPSRAFLFNKMLDMMIVDDRS
jgi:hypothetical protein